MALISPMRRLPQDVLLEIFSSCLPSEHNALIDPSEAPLLLGRICRHWRDVAYSAPILWSSIHIPSLDYAPLHILLELERKVAMWLGRSATCPLSISLSNYENYIPHSDKENYLLPLPQLIAVSKRLRCLGVCGGGEFLRPLLRLAPEDVPLLKRIHIRSFADAIPLMTNILQAPTLEDMELVSSLDDPLSLPLQWPLLRRFHFDCFDRWTQHGQEGGLDFETALDVLRQCPNLEQCEIRINKKTSEPLESARNLFPVNMPQLHTLILKGPGIHLAHWIPDLVVPKLRFLRIADRPWDDEFLACLCPPHNLCPMLTELTLTGPSNTFSDAAVLALIQARMTMVTPLQRFRAEFLRKKELDIIPDLQSFISDGLQVTLEYPSLWEFKPRAGLDAVRY
ncbi:hypothetical protein C8R45DRAFT_488794 [Mycena sanguinolenta]|nr:hypothetical protein C8R45DRAFT_488794 [Mycena sanguinolenta]